MSAWGVGSFENESGAAFVEEVMDDGVFALAEAFEVAVDPENDYLEAEEGHRALAAAELLAAALTGDMQFMPEEEVATWVQGLKVADLAPLRDLALDAIERVLGPDSELPDLWEDTADAGLWKAEVQRLRAALS